MNFSVTFTGKIETKQQRERKGMANPNQSMVLRRNQLIVSALCNRLHLDSKIFDGDVLQSDIKSLCKNIYMARQSEVMKWIEFAENCNVDSEACLRALNELNECLVSKSVLVGGGLTPSEADVFVFSAIYTTVKGLSDSERNSLPHLLRWMDYIQNTEDFGETFEQILVEKAKFDPLRVKEDANAKKTAQGKKDEVGVERGSSSIKPADVVRGDSQAPAEKKKLPGKVADEKDKNIGIAGTEKKNLPEKVADEKDKDISVSLLKIQVGLIRKAWKHPSADSLLVEEIDTGDAKLRQVVSGLAKYCNADDLTNRRVVLITNVKPGKLRDVMSEGLVLCASNDDHTVVEPITPPEGAKVGECVSFSGHEGKPEEVLNPKKKQLEKITPHLFTDDKGVATFKGIPFTTSCGSCTSSIPNASIK
ncbi:methionine--tRNA ligase, cytoplasmic isoform X2 [Rhododendron vialii]|uniref:methionine--tRNA ligase, cytoplasmic isoform X2 n=1 Tax=Rhododendron vialii TaxID=182163 RepID=UPI00265F1363|nr:methionine--tRNA ligase, cytoplasmic isoform X2 [Rhododendron vialii]